MAGIVIEIMKKIIFFILSILFLGTNIFAYDCPGKKNCPTGWYELSCDHCLAIGYHLTNTTDQYACPDESWSPDGGITCCINGSVLSADGKACVPVDKVNDPVTCREGYSWVAINTCCPTGKFLSGTGLNRCCVDIQGANCCPPSRIWIQKENPANPTGDEIGVCSPLKPVELEIR